MTGGAALFADFRKRIDRYRDARDFPAVKGPSYLSVHLRFGTVSIRELAAYAHQRSLEPDGDGAATWLSELIWREFYAQILWHHPHVVTGAFKPEYDTLAFPNDPARFAAWCDGRTGYPIVDAAMRQLNTTGYMHNRLRMVAASLPREGPAGRLALGRALLRRRAARLRSRVEQRRLAVGGVDRLRRATVFPHLQSGDAVGALRRRRASSSAATCRRSPRSATAKSTRRGSFRPRYSAAKGIAIGRDYPAPIVDHAGARAAALALFKVRAMSAYSSSCLRDFLYSATSCCCRFGGACS